MVALNPHVDFLYIKKKNVAIQKLDDSYQI